MVIKLVSSASSAGIQQNKHNCQSKLEMAEFWSEAYPKTMNILENCPLNADRTFGILLFRHVRRRCRLPIGR